jgi:hypothetical protein
MKEKREDLAAYAHRAWSGWMNYLFGKCRYEHIGGKREMVIPEWAVER